MRKRIHPADAFADAVQKNLIQKKTSKQAEQEREVAIRKRARAHEERQQAFYEKHLQPVIKKLVSLPEKEGSYRSRFFGYR